MKLTLEGIKEKKDWESAGVKLPSYDIDTIVARTKESPEWVHFGAGNIFRIFLNFLNCILFLQNIPFGYLLNVISH